MRLPVLLLLLSSTLWSAPTLALPTDRQVRWFGWEAYAFVHFTLNTFTDREWGEGDESPSLFAPTAFDARQIARTVRDAGLTGLVLTAKHHDGFCLWPSAHTEHSVKHSPFRNGKGDVVREIADACREYGLQFGIYLSPWDRNHPQYGSPEYIAYYRAQLEELLTHYGPIFEVWFDGANGGTGYYGGAREKREIDRLNYYDWANTWALVRRLQPDAALFSDAGPDCRWVGNEIGVAGDPCWSTINAAGFAPGQASNLEHGDRFGTHFIPAEVDVSIRPGWFYHAAEDDKVKTPQQLYSIFLTSVGRGANLILNLAPDRRGLIPDQDVASLREWNRLREATFAVNLATRGQLLVGEQVLPLAPLIDGDRLTAWTPETLPATGEWILELPDSATFDLVDLREDIRLGHRVGAWELAVEIDGAWHTVAQGEAVGARRLIPLPLQTTRRVKWRWLDAAASPALTELGLYLRPEEVRS